MNTFSAVMGLKLTIYSQDNHLVKYLRILPCMFINGQCDNVRIMNRTTVKPEYQLSCKCSPDIWLTKLFFFFFFFLFGFSITSLSSFFTHIESIGRWGENRSTRGKTT